jgi:hypothetical protein
MSFVRYSGFAAAAAFACSLAAPAGAALINHKFLPLAVAKTIVETSRAPAYSYRASRPCGQRAQGPAFPKTLLDEGTVTTKRLQECPTWAREWQAHALLKNLIGHRG